MEDIFNSSPAIQTTDVDEAIDVLSRVYLPVKLRLTALTEIPH